MDETRFWTIIESGGAKALADQERQLAAIHQQLLELSPDEIRDFLQLFKQKLADAYTWDLWGAAYRINGGCSDDGFDYFRSWLISRGRAVYEAAIANPDTLAAVTDPERDDYEFEDLLYIPLIAYEELTGEEMPPIDFHWPSEPRGQHWGLDDDEQVSKRLPMLAKAYRN